MRCRYELAILFLLVPFLTAGENGPDGSEPPREAAAGEPCTQSTDCEGELVCVGQACKNLDAITSEDACRNVATLTEREDGVELVQCVEDLEQLKAECQAGDELIQCLAQVEAQGAMIDCFLHCVEHDGASRSGSRSGVASPKAGVGESCGRSSDCKGELVCVERACEDLGEIALEEACQNLVKVTGDEGEDRLTKCVRELESIKAKCGVGDKIIHCLARVKDENAITTDCFSLCVDDASTGDRDIDAVRWIADGALVYFMEEHHGETSRFPPGAGCSVVGGETDWDSSPWRNLRFRLPHTPTDHQYCYRADADQKRFAASVREIGSGRIWCVRGDSGPGLSAVREVESREECEKFVSD